MCSYATVLKFGCPGMNCDGMKIVGEVALRISQPKCSYDEKISVPNISVSADHQKIIVCSPLSPAPLIAIHFIKVFLKLDENCGSSCLLEFLTSEILQSAPNDPKLNSKNQTQKYTTY